MSVLEEEAVAPAIEQESCSLDNYLALPDHSMDERIAEARRKLGKSTILLGHHYQRDEVIRFADLPPDFRQLLRPEEDQGKQEDHNGVGKVHSLS